MKANKILNDFSNNLKVSDIKDKEQQLITTLKIINDLGFTGATVENIESIPDKHINQPESFFITNLVLICFMSCLASMGVILFLGALSGSVFFVMSSFIFIVVSNDYYVNKLKATAIDSIKERDRLVEQINLKDSNNETI